MKYRYYHQRDVLPSEKRSSQLTLVREVAEDPTGSNSHYRGGILSHVVQPLPYFRCFGSRSSEKSIAVCDGEERDVTGQETRCSDAGTVKQASLGQVVRHAAVVTPRVFVVSR